MNNLLRFKFFLWKFSKFKVPLIGYLNPRLLTLTDEEIVVKIKLNRRSKNHLNSMYFGALSVGADLAGGLHSFYFADKLNVNCSIVFKSFQADFIKRPEANVYFVCNVGHFIRDMIIQSKETKERITEDIPVTAYINYFDEKEEVAKFYLGLSVRVN